MNEYQNLLASYQESIHLLEGRIADYTKAIRAGGGEGDPRTGKLAKSRFRLYRQLWDLQYASQEVSSYLDAITARGVKPQANSQRILIKRRVVSDKIGVPNH